MSCTNPLYGLRLGAINPATGKERMKILPREDDYFYLCKKHGKDSVVIIPCGKCPSCIEARSKSWALRCVCEASLHKENCFLTLTYNDKSLPKGLCKKDVQKFIKSLRYKFPDNNIRYFGCSEFGSHTKRLHHHLIIFGLFPDDAKYATTIQDNIYFSSKKIQECWPFGFVSISDCTYASCAYVARYTQKKMDDPNFRGCTYCSLKPGIGADYFNQHKDFIYKYDLVFGNFGKTFKSKPSRYFDKLYERLAPDEFQLLKDKRLSIAESKTISELIENRLIYYEDLLKVKAKVKSKKFEILKRKEL